MTGGKLDEDGVIVKAVIRTSGYISISSVVAGNEDSKHGTRGMGFSDA